MTAANILAKVEQVYRDCTTYRDTGVVNVTFYESRGERLVTKPFKTVFVRPDRFRFEYEESDFIGRTKRYIIWEDRGPVKTWWDVRREVGLPGSLGTALAAAAGVSSGSSHAIPVLLMRDEVGGRRLVDIANAKRLPDETERGVECFKIIGEYATRPMAIWIDKKTFLVRKFEYFSRFSDFRTRTTTTYQPFLNQPVADKLFVFDAPEG